MAVPWLRLLDAALGIHDLVRTRRPRAIDDAQVELRRRGPGRRGFESRLAGVVVAALRETFDRDSRRLELEREQFEMARARAERSLRIELARQSADREVSRARFITGTSAAMFVATLLFAPRLAGVAAASWFARSVLGAAWLLLIMAIASSLSEQSTLARVLDRVVADPDAIDDIEPLTRSALAPWCLIAGLALVALAALIS
jgi:hypothetical protein